jgi:hypothetical protein
MIVRIFDEEGTKLDSWFVDAVPAIGDTVEVGYVAVVEERHWIVSDDDVIVQLKVKEVGH